VAAATCATAFTACSRDAQAMTPQSIEQQYGVAGAYTDTVSTADGSLRGTLVPVTQADGRTAQLFIPAKASKEPHAVYLRDDEGLHPVMTLTTRLIAIKQVPAGETVGYAGTWRAATDNRIGIAALGYGDGYPRHAGSGTPVLVGGRPAALAGRVSMDMLAIDLEGHPEAQVGTPVTLWGEGLPVETIAAHAGTIAYELLCGITGRVHVEIVEREPGT